MKNFIILLSMLSLSFCASGQSEDEENNHKFRKDNIFLGGSIGLGLGGGGFSVGANPEIGYTIAQWLDAGISTNFNYYYYSPEYNGGYSQKSFNIGSGVFVRLFPFKGLFLQVLPEVNRITTHVKDVYNGGAEERLKQNSKSLLLGIGYGSRMVGEMNYFTVLMFDAGTDINSPYIGYLGSKLPILRTGFNFYLRPKRRESKLVL